MIENILNGIGKIIDKVVPDAGEAERLKNEIQKEAFKHDGLLANAMRDVIVAEAQCEIGDRI
ncbi:MAG: hypothetical protein HRU28_16370 [Rhizobiales bacterium]|nr:hypothetical protein [Hyphomicrobiales bacterium]